MKKVNKEFMTAYSFLGWEIWKIGILSQKANIHGL